MNESLAERSALRADVHLSSPDLVLSHTLRSAAKLTFEVEHQATAESMFVTVTADDVDAGAFETVESALASDPTVESYRTSVCGDDERVYAIDLAVDRALVSEVAAQRGIRVLSAWSRGGETGWTFELAVPDREDLVDFRSYWEQRDVGFDLRRLFHPDLSASASVGGLSPPQREALLAAHERGYFDVPRGCSQRDLAEALGASPTAVSQRLRRAMGTLVAETLVEE